jgi:hypothetical protein
MYQIIALILLLTGTALLFFVNSIIDKNTNNNTLQFIHANNVVIGFVCLAGSYYASTIKETLLSMPAFEHSDINTSDALNA